MNPQVAFVMLLATTCGFASGQNNPDKTTPSNNPQRVETGITEAGKTNWRPYKHAHQGIVVDVDTSEKHFTKTPNYVISIHGNGNHWNLLGTASVYNPTPKGFQVYLRWANDKELTPAYANEQNWRVAWIAVEN